MVGNFETETPTDELYHLVAEKCRDIMSRHPIREIGGHRDYMATACPGRNFDIQVVRQMVAGIDSQLEWKQNILQEAATAGLIDPQINHQPDEPASKWFVLAVALNLLKKITEGK